VSSAYCWRLW